MSFVLGVLAGAALIMLIPPKYEDWLRQFIVNQWKKITKKG
jgi:hypothetical protein